MAIPTLDQTEGIWISRTNGQGYHYVQDVFPGNTISETVHRNNCQLLIQRGSLLPEYKDGLLTHQKVWEETRRYCRVHI